MLTSKKTSPTTAQVPGELSGGRLLLVTRHSERALGHRQEKVGHQADCALGILAGNRDRRLALADRFGDCEHRADAPRLLGATDVDVTQAISDVSMTSPRHSRVKSSTKARIRKRRPLASVSMTKSSDQRRF